MAMPSKHTIKQILLTTWWILLGVGCTVLLAAAVGNKNHQRCKRVEVHINGAHNHFFIDQPDVMKVVADYAGQNPVGLPMGDFDLVGMEAQLEKDVWVKDAEVYFDNHRVLQVAVEEREPIARVFTNGTRSFYIDDSPAMLPLSDKFSARVPVFTGFPSEALVLSKADSNLLKEIKTVSRAIERDSFLNILIQQVAINSQRHFEMIPTIGNQVILLGDASDLDAKVRKLKLFYEQVIAKYGWNRYSLVNLQYKGQVVAKLKGADDVSADSLRTIQLMQHMAATAEQLASDSIQTIIQDNERNTADSTMIIQVLPREDEAAPSLFFDESEEPAAPKPQPVTAAPARSQPVHAPAVRPPTKPAVRTAHPGSKPAQPKPPKQRPKVQMPKRNH